MVQENVHVYTYRVCVYINIHTQGEGRKEKVNETKCKQLVNMDKEYVSFFHIGLTIPPRFEVA